MLEDLLRQAASPDPAVAGAAADALFREVAERLADTFQPALCDAYTRLFSRVIARFDPEWEAPALVSRYERIRRPRPYPRNRREPETVFVLSRVTLGADVAVTSLLLDAVKQRFPGSEIRLAGGRKSGELFAADCRIRYFEASYPRRGTLRERLAAGWRLRKELSRPGTLVIDPDSRLTQLGLLPVCPEEHYYFFESRSYGGDGPESLSELARRWVAETFGVRNARAYLALDAPATRTLQPGITVSFGVGENPAKRVPDPFEGELLRHLSHTGLPVLVDKGAGGEEAERVERAIQASRARAGAIATWEGSFAGFAARIAASRLYVGYDSAGQHAAAAAGTPAVAVFAGYPSERFLDRWRPTGPGPVAVVRAEAAPPGEVLRRTLQAVTGLLRSPA